jgi:hypothetical protein
MSQVHDALKRAGGSDKNRPRPPDTQGRLKQVGDPGGSSLGLWVVAVLALSLAGWFFWHWWSARHAAAPGKKAPVAAAALNSAPAPEVNATDAPPSVPASRADAAWPADLKLMGIISSTTNPMALINGQTVGVGDAIEGIRITKIDRDKVVVEWNGQEKELRMK